MARFITIGYGDEAGYTATNPAIRNAAHAHDEKLRAAGAIMGIAGKPVQVRNTDAKGTLATPGSYLQSALPVAGFALLEADSLEAAIELVALSPCAVARGVIEVWPVDNGVG